MRLIDADAINPMRCPKSISEMREWINEQPTVCDIEQIRNEIDRIEINGQVDEHTMFIRPGEQVRQMALDIIDKYIKGENK